MLINDYCNLIISKGFQYAQSNLQNIHIFFHSSDNEILNICILINNTDGTFHKPELIETLFTSIERKILFNGYKKVQPFYIIFSDYIERDKIYGSHLTHYWIIDTLCNRIMIFDNQPDDYFYLKTDFEKLLNNPNKNVSLKLKNFPIITTALITLNILIFIVLEFIGNTQSSEFMLENGAAYWKYIYENGEYYRLFTCMFLHFGSEHLLNNMISLFFIGRETEKFLGPVRFSFIYLFSGLGASILSSIYYMNNNNQNIIVSAGASGAIFGILGAFVIITLLYKKQRRTIRPANFMIIIVLSLLNGYMNSNIDNMAHIGGLLCGLILTFITCLCRKNILQ